MSPSETVLVNMPWAPVIQPSLSLGLLKAILQQAGFSCSVRYCNLEFAADAGEQAFRAVLSTISSDYMRDWVFRRSAFSEFHCNDREYIDLVYSRNPMKLSRSEFTETAFSVRDSAEAFVKRTAESIAAGSPLFVGCTTSMNQHVASLALLRYLRELSPETVTVLGGANCDGTMGQATHRWFPWVDYVVSGEADGIIVKIAELVSQFGSSPPRELLPSGLLAPVYRTEGYPKTCNAVYDALDELPLPDYREYFRALEESPGWLSGMILPSLPVETSRGCWWSSSGGCSFCGIDHTNGRFISKNPEKVQHEFQELVERYGTGRIQTADNVMDQSYFSTLLPALSREKKHYRLFYEVRPTESPRKVELLEQAGINWIWSGIESLSTKVLSLANKGVKAWQNIQFLKECRSRGIYVGWNLMCDFPGEDDRWYSEMAELLSLCVHLQPPAACARVRLDRYSEYHRNPEKYRLKLRPARLSRYIYPLTEDQLEEQVYFFEDTDRWADPQFESILNRPGISSVKSSVDRWMKVFHSRAPAVLSILDDGAVSTVTDSRIPDFPVAWQFTGIEREALLASHQAPPEKDMEMRFPGILKKLEELGLLVLLDGHAVGLCLHGEVNPLPDVSEYPGGGLISPAMRRRMERGGSP
jgi:ribosomal peptide maturation radical SAM protein 1